MLSYILKITLFIILSIIIYNLYFFIDKDNCLDSWWSYNNELKKCEKNDLNQDFLKEITYSNLIDSNSKDILKKVFKNSWLQEKNIKNFFDSVDNYNYIMKDILKKEGFIKTQNLNPKYDELNLSNKWNEKNNLFPGHNCRITSYNLMRNFFTITKTENKDISNLFVDEDAIEYWPKWLFTENEKNIFESFYSKIPTVLTKDISIHLEKIKQNWKDKWINFIYKNDKTKASLISVFFHSYFEAVWDIPEENFLFIWHTWVLIPYNNELFFIEKVSFTEPYQILKFKNRIELNDYLMNKYDIEYNQQNSSPFILENDELLNWYRENLNKQNNNI